MSESTLQVDAATDGPRLRISVCGEATIYTVQELKERLSSMPAACREIVIDLSRVTDFDTCGLQVLLVAQREAAEARRTLHIKAPSHPVRDLLKLYGLADQIPTCEAQPAGSAP